MDKSNHPLASICRLWITKIDLALKYKKKVFGDDAAEAMRFFNGPHDFQYEGEYVRGSRKDDAELDIPYVTFRMCLVAGTPVRMSDGTEKPVECVRAGDEVIGHSGQPRKVLEVFNRAYTGSLTTVTLNGFPFPLTMTADHKMAVWAGDGINWTPSREISEGDPMLIGWNRTFQENKFLDIAKLLGPKAMRSSLPVTVPITPSLARLIGLYLAEGSNSTCSVTFTFGPHEEHYAREVASLGLGIFGVKCHVYFTANEGKGNWKASFKNKNLKVLFSALCPGLAKTKRAPAFIFGADADTKLAMLLGWLNGDGHGECATKGKRHTLQMFGVTVSPGLARDMTILAIGCGIRAKTYLLPHYRGCSDRYTVTLSGAKAAALFPAVLKQANAVGHVFKPVDKEYTKFGCIRKVKTITYEEVTDRQVYDFEVEEDHSFLVGDVISSNSANKVAELVALYGPLLYHRNPYRMVSPKKHWMPPESFFMPVQLQALADQAQQTGQQLPPQIQMMLQSGQQQFQKIQMDEASWSDANQARTQLLQGYLNTTPRTLFLKDEMRLAIDEALIKGMGILVTEIYQPPGSPLRLAGSFYESVDNLVVDPDMEQIKTAKWIAIRQILPTWQVEHDYNLPRGTLRGTMESMNRTAEVDSDTTDNLQWARKQGRSNDLTAIWKVYSRMGIGARLEGADPGLKDSLDKMGENCYLVICRDVPYPLNLAPNILQQFGEAPPDVFMQEVTQRLDWPIPFWEDNDWPFTEISFHDVPRQPWPMSPIKPALGYQKFLNWCYSFLAAKIKNTSRDFIAIPKQADEELKQAILKGGDLALLEIDAQHKTIKEVVEFLQHPQMNGDILKVLEVIESAFEKATGLSEAMYGVNRTQPRSAQESAMRGDMLRLRPDDMGEKVESAATRIAKKEAIAAAWALKGADVAPALGQTAASFWDQLIAQHDFQAIIHEFDYRLEAGSSRKPNKDKAVTDTTEGVNVLLPILQGYAQATGDVGPVNAFMQDWCQARDLDPQGYMLKPPPPQQGPTPDQMKMQSEQQKAQINMQSMQAKAQMDQQKLQADMAADQQRAQLDQRMAAADLQGKEMEMRMSSREAMMKMAMEDQAFKQKMAQDKAKSDQDMQLARAKAQSPKTNGAGRQR